MTNEQIEKLQKDFPQDLHWLFTYGQQKELNSYQFKQWSWQRWLSMVAIVATTSIGATTLYFTKTAEYDTKIAALEEKLEQKIKSIEGKQQ